MVYLYSFLLALIKDIGVESLQGARVMDKLRTLAQEVGRLSELFDHDKDNIDLRRLLGRARTAMYSVRDSKLGEIHKTCNTGIDEGRLIERAKVLEGEDG